MKRLIIIIAAGLVIGVAGVAAFVMWYSNTPASEFDDEVIVDIPRGSALTTIASKLESQGVVNDARVFRVYVQAQKKETSIQAGEYAFQKNLTPREVLDVLVSGRTVRYKFTVPEGYNAKQIVKVIAASDLAVDEAVLLELTEDAKFAKKIGVPADRLEGYLFPDTYEFEKYASERDIFKEMVERWEKEITPKFKKRAAELDLTIHEVVTLASIVEKETGLATERAIIAGVFHNRMAKGMRLETDPTVIYGIKDFDGDIRYRDLRDATNPYNTYVIKGLPPGPIASPGADALEATLWYATHEYLYFVSKNDGSHHFSPTYKEHLRYVKKYQMRN